MATSPLAQTLSIITGSSSGYPLIVNQDVVNAVSSSATVIATGDTITTTGVSVARVAPAAAVTGVILEKGTQQGQEVVVVNESTSADSVTFAASGTSFVADGTSDVISGLTAARFIWDGSLWYHVV